MDLAGRLWNGKAKPKAGKMKRKQDQGPATGSARKMETVE
jgi:hypothetical protein